MSRAWDDDLTAPEQVSVQRKRSWAETRYGNRYDSRKRDGQSGFEQKDAVCRKPGDGTGQHSPGRQNTGDRREITNQQCGAARQEHQT